MSISYEFYVLRVAPVLLVVLLCIYVPTAKVAKKDSILLLLILLGIYGVPGGVVGYTRTTRINFASSILTECIYS